MFRIYAIKITAYLDKNETAMWWASWLKEAKKCMEPLDPIAIEGKYSVTCKRDH